MAAPTQADLDRLDAAIAAGGIVKSMTFADNTYEFRDVDDMFKLRGWMVGQINAAAGTPRTYRLATTSKAC